MFNVECTDYVGTDIFKDCRLEYNDGVNIGVSNVFILLYEMISEKVMKPLGMKWSYAMGDH